MTYHSRSTPDEAGEGRPLFGIRFSGATFEEMVHDLSAKPLPGQGVRMVVTANLDHIVQLRDHAGLRKAYERAWRRTIDGAPVLLYARWRKAGVPGRVTGADLFPALLARFEPSSHRPFFVAASGEIAAGLRRWGAGKGFTPDSIGIDVPPFGFDANEGYGERLADAIREHGTTHLIFGLGCPKSETWIDHHRDQLGDCYAIAVGAALGFFVGTDRRAPGLVGRIGMEGLWRVGQEPRRLSRRYFVRSWGFLAAITDDLRRTKK